MNFLINVIEKILARLPSFVECHAFVNYPMRFFGLLKQIKSNLLSTIRARVDMRIDDVSIIKILHFKNTISDRVKVQFFFK